MRETEKIGGGGGGGGGSDTSRLGVKGYTLQWMDNTLWEIHGKYIKAAPAVMPSSMAGKIRRNFR